MPDTDIYLREQTAAERERLAELLATLTPEQWGTPALCAGWRIREVVAHMTMPFRISPPRFLFGLAAAGFSFNRYADRAARADTARLGDAELLAALRDNIDHPWRPPGGGSAGALAHDVIHGLDMTEPLGLPSAPPERIATVVRNATAKSLAFFGVDLTGWQLRATDTDLVIGSGTEQLMPAKDVLLTISGRRPLPV